MVARPPLVTPEQYVPALTGLRAVAAYAVFLHHYNPAPPGTSAHQLLDQGYVGVSLFFVLSGFLIYHRYADAYLNRRNWSWRRYARNRFARIFPLYWLLLLATVLVTWLQGRPMPTATLLLNLSLLKGLSEVYKFSGIAQSWSLTVELCFYVLAPILFRLLNRWGIYRLGITLSVVGLITALMTGYRAGNTGLTQLSFISFYTFPGRSFEFIVGMALARQWHREPHHVPRYGLTGGWLLVSACIGWQAIGSVPDEPVAALLSEVIVYNYGLPVGLGLMLWGLLDRSPPRGQLPQRHSLAWPVRLLSHPLMQTLGRSSYAFYLIHIGLLPKLLIHSGLAPNCGVFFVWLLLLAYGLYVGIERPLHRRLRTGE